MIAEPFQTLLYLILVPLIVQAARLLAAKLGKPIPIGVFQGLAAALAVAFVFLNGGFAGLEIPVFAGDPAAFVGAWLTLVVAAWGPVELLYRVIFKAIFERVGLA
jgi:hypothetical protein